MLPDFQACPSCPTETGPCDLCTQAALLSFFVLCLAFARAGGVGAASGPSPVHTAKQEPIYASISLRCVCSSARSLAGNLIAEVHSCLRGGMQHACRKAGAASRQPQASGFGLHPVGVRTCNSRTHVGCNPYAHVIFRPDLPRLQSLVALAARCLAANGARRRSKLASDIMGRHISRLNILCRARHGGLATQLVFAGMHAGMLLLTSFDFSFEQPGCFYN